MPRYGNLQLLAEPRNLAGGLLAIIVPLGRLMNDSLARWRVRLGVEPALPTAAGSAARRVTAGEARVERGR